MNFNEIEESLVNVNNLEELFKLWKQAHIVDEKWKSNTEQGIIQDSFIEDGYICENKDDYNGILFILLEANEGDYGMSQRENEAFYRNSQIQFYRGYVNGDETDTKSKIKEKLGRMAYYIEKNEVAEESDFKASLNRSAFMNPNKRGGVNHPDPETVSSYFSRYKKFIQKQIELINPNYIICIGSYGYLKDIGIVNEKYLNMWHTAYSMRERERTQKYKLGDPNVDLYIEEFVNRYDKQFKKI